MTDRIGEGPAYERDPSAMSMFGASLKKNFQQKWRDKCQLTLEITLPFFFVVGIVAIWAAVGSESEEDTQFIFYDSPFENVYEASIREALCLDPNSDIGREAASRNGSGGPSSVLWLCAQPDISQLKCQQNATPRIPFAGLCVQGSPFSYFRVLENITNVRTLLTLDEVFLMRFGWILAELDDTERAEWTDTTRSLSTPGLLRFAPDTPVVRDVARYFNESSFYARYMYGGIFPSNEQLAAYTKTLESEELGGTMAAIVVNKMSAVDGFDVNIRMNASNIAFTNNDNLILRYFSGGLGVEEGIPQQSYVHTGFGTLQKMLYEYYITNQLSTSAPGGGAVSRPAEPKIAPMPFKKYTEWIFLQVGADQGYFSLFMVLAYLYPVSQLVKAIVLEKENRVREAMLIMGLSTSTFYTSWFVTYALIYIPSSLLPALLMLITFFPKNNFGAVFFLLYLFSISTISLAGLLSTFFSKAREAALTAPIVFFILAIPLFIVDNLGVAVRGLFLLLSPSAVTEGFTLLARYEQTGGMSSKDVSSARDDINMLTVLFMLAIDTVLYALLALYFDAVIPSEWGTRKHPCFCFTEPCRYFRRKDGEGSVEECRKLPDGRDPCGAFENAGKTTDDEGANPVKVEMLGLVKRFERGDNSFTAVDRLHLQLRQNEVSVLLGHNGAGKTTAINLLTGMLEIDEGDAFVHGKSVTHDLAAVRNMTGLCPQHNILWPELTCAQHLRFYAQIKGVPADLREGVVDDMLTSVDLMDKKDYFSENLSGGQKRKLSVAIAFIGGSELVILDEPTAGMDVAARRHTWELIKRMAPGRCVLLTTHYMDEADLLGQKISIMDKGRLRCEGSGMFLKQSYSVGYTVAMSVDHGAQKTAEIDELFRRVVSRSEKLQTGGEEVAFRVPAAQASAFPELLRALEDDGPAMGIRGFGVSVTTMEDVFLHIVKTPIGEDVSSNVQTPLVVSPGMQQGAGYDGRNPEHSNHQPVNDVVPPMSAQNGDEGEKRTPQWATPASEEHRTLGRQFQAQLWKRLNAMKRDRRAVVTTLLRPIGGILLSMLLLLIELFPSQQEIILDSSLYQKVSVGDMSYDFSQCPATWTTSGNRPRDTMTPNYIVRNVEGLSTAGELSQHLLDTFSTQPRDRYLAFQCQDSRLGPVVFANYSGYHVYGEALALYYQLAIADSTVDSVPPRMVTRNHPLPWTDRQSAIFGAIRTFLVAIVILIPFTFIPSAFVTWAVKEKETKAKHLQFSSGLNYVVYWLSNLIFDMAVMVVLIILVIFIFLAFGRDEFVGNGENFGATFLVMFFYGLSSAGVAYALSFLFKEHAAAQNVVMMANFICGFLLVFMVFMFRFFESTEDAADILAFIFRIVPSFCLGESLLNLASLEFARALDIDAGPFDMDQTGWNLVYMALEFPLFFGITLLLDHPALLRREQQLLHNPDELPPKIEEEEDVDVARERERVESGNAEDDILVVKHLHKHYPSVNKTAVADLSFGVHKGEVFGFLGTNGAGKTTTISILCGEQLPTHGRGSITGYDVVEHSAKAQQQIGYCPQFDALLDLLTAKEHLELYAGLRGVPVNRVDAVAEELIDVCGLAEHRHTLASNMSGGNKRKLSVAIALIGGPSLVFLDEPSAGMDPVARRGLWSVVEEIARHASVVLTTHHLEEVEALAHRVAIMVDGKLKCVGDKTHLKTKYGSGFEMQVRLHNMDAVEPFQQFMSQYMNVAADLMEERGVKFTYALRSPEDQVAKYESLPDSEKTGEVSTFTPLKLSAVFGLLEEHKAAAGIADYSVSATTIESVFLRISEAADEEAHNHHQPAAN